MPLGGRLYLRYQYGPDGPEPPPRDFWDSWWVSSALALAIVGVGALIWAGTWSKDHVPVMRNVLSVVGVVQLLGRLCFRGTFSHGPSQPGMEAWLRSSWNVYQPLVSCLFAPRGMTRNAWLEYTLWVLTSSGLGFLSVLQRLWI